MKRKLISILFALVLVLTLGLVTAVPVAAAATLTVDDDWQTGLPPYAEDTDADNDFATIQAAINAASTNDTILANDGSYTEDLTIPAGKTNLEIVSVNGASATTIKGVALSVWLKSTLPNIEILAQGVSIHGFTIQGPDPVGTQFAAGMIIGAQDVEIYSNAFQVNNANDIIAGDDISQGIVTYNKLAIPGVDISGLSIHDNTFTHRGIGVIGYEGIYINRDAGTGSISIADNTFTGDIIRGITVERSDATISGNSLVVTGGWLWTGVLVMNVGSTEAQTNVSVTGNTITGFDNGIKVGGGIPARVLTNISITQNTITGNYLNGILVRSSALGVVINNNNIVGNITYGVQNTDSGNLLNAQSNWWGAADGPSQSPGSGDRVSADVDFTNWLTSQYGDDLGSVGMTASFTANVGISVTPTTLNFGAVVPNVASDPETVTVTNTGNVDVDLTASLSGISTPDVYTTGLTIGGSSVGGWSVTDLIPTDTSTPTLILTVPGGTPSGTYTATLIFWAEAS